MIKTKLGFKLKQVNRDKEFELDKTSLSIGRDANCDIVLDQGNTSRVHARIFFNNGKIIIEDGVWIGAKSVVLQNVTCKNHSVLSVNSVASSNLDEYSIYRGNPAVRLKDRV